MEFAPTDQSAQRGPKEGSFMSTAPAYPEIVENQGRPRGGQLLGSIVGGVLALTIAVMLLPATARAADTSHVRNIVLVHGAFADGSSWSDIIPLLEAKGYHVTAVQNPLTSLADDVAATRRVLERQKGDVLLVGHSGLVLS